MRLFHLAVVYKKTSDVHRTPSNAKKADILDSIYHPLFLLVYKLLPD